MLIGANSGITDTAGYINIEQPMGNMPRTPLLRRVGGGKESPARSFYRRLDMHRPRIIGNDQVSSLDKRAQGRKGEYTGQRVHRPPVALLHMAEYTLDQFLLIFGTSEENCSAKLFNQPVNNFDIHLPWIGACRHAASRMHHNQSWATPR